MSRTYFIDWTRDDEAETSLTVEYKIYGGCPVHMGSMNYPGHPAEAPEVEIQEAYIKPPNGGFITKSTPTVTLTDAELEKLATYILENHEDDDDDPDAAAERRAEDRRDDDMMDRLDRAGEDE